MPREKVMKREEDVRKYINKLLDKHHWFHWNVVQGPYSASGVADKHAFRGGVYIAIEAKYGKTYGSRNKPTTLQRAFLQTVLTQSGLAFVVHNHNIGEFERWLELFDTSIEHVMTNKGMLSTEQGAEMLDCIRVLTEDIVAGKQFLGDA